MHTTAHSLKRLPVRTYTLVHMHSFNAICYYSSNLLFLIWLVNIGFTVFRIFYTVVAHKSLCACFIIKVNTYHCAKSNIRKLLLMQPKLLVNLPLKIQYWLDLILCEVVDHKMNNRHNWMLRSAWKSKHIYKNCSCIPVIWIISRSTPAISTAQLVSTSNCSCIPVLWIIARNRPAISTA